MKSAFWVLVIILVFAAIVIVVLLYSQPVISECMKAVFQHNYDQCRILIGR